MRVRVLGLLSCISASCIPGSEPASLNSVRHKVAEVEAHAVSSDGRFLTYTDWDAGNLALLDLRTGESSLLTNKATWSESEEYADNSIVSSEQELIAYVWFNEASRYDVHIVGLDGSDPRVLYRGEAFEAIQLHDWSPEGEHILVTSSGRGGSHEVALLSLADGSKTVLSTLQGSVSRPPLRMSFSPDGRYIAHDRPAQDDHPRRTISLLRTDGGFESTLVGGDGNYLLLDWSPDGSGIVFLSDRSGTWDTWAQEVRGGESYGRAELLEQDSGLLMHRLGFGQDGSYYYGASTWENDVYVVVVDSSSGLPLESTKLVDHVGFDTSVEWSPDGQRLVYAYGHGWMPDPWVVGILAVDEAEEDLLQIDELTRWGSHPFRPRWSPDGEFLLAEGADDGGRQGIYTIEIATGMIRPIVQDDAGPLQGSNWAADDQIVFTRRIASSPRRIVARDLGSGEERELHREEPPIRVIRPAISADGRWLAFISRDEEKGSTALKVVSTVDGETRQLLQSTPPRFLAAVAWSGDGRQLLFGINDSVDGESVFELQRIAVGGGSPQWIGIRVKGMSVFSLSINQETGWIAYTAGHPEREEVWVRVDLWSEALRERVPN